MYSRTTVQRANVICCDGWTCPSALRADHIAHHFLRERERERGVGGGGWWRETDMYRQTDRQTDR